MKDELFLGLSGQEIIDNLEAECYRKEPMMTFFKPFDDDERMAVEFNLIELIKQAHGMNEMLKDLKKNVKALSAELHYGGRSVTEDVYVFVNHITEKASLYNNRGELIAKRTLTQEERQLKIN
jgi:hypothetical protein